MVDKLQFPRAFRWGAATSAHQVEGDNRNNQWWDWEQKPGFIRDGSATGRACDHYHLYEHDFDLAKELRHQVHRLSIEWSRIEPKEGKWNDKEVAHYRAVLEALRSRRIESMVTCHHFTNPRWLEAKGAWLKPEAIDRFERYVRFLGEQFGDLVTYWNTINEPMIVMLASYLVGEHPPCHQDLAEAGTVARHLLQAHGRAYHALHAAASDAGHSRPAVGPVMNLMPAYPLDKRDPAQVRAAQIFDDLFNGWFLEGIAQGRFLPPLGDGTEVAQVQNTWDFIGVNYYSVVHMKDLTYDAGQAENWPADKPTPERSDTGWFVYPDGFYAALSRVGSYRRPVWITENGIATTDETRRTRFLLNHLQVLHRAIRAGVDVRGYLWWSLLDNFEWREGRSKRFGLVEVNYDTLARRVRPTAHVYQDIIQRNAISSAQLSTVHD